MYFSFSRLCEERRHRVAATRRRRLCRRTRARRRCRSGAGRPPRRPAGPPAGTSSSSSTGAGVAGAGRGEHRAVRLGEPRRRRRRSGLRPDRARRVRHLGAARGGVDVDDDGQVDRESEVAAQRVTDRPAQDPLDRVLGELARRGEQRGAVDEAERAGQAEERALLRRQRGGAGARRGAGQIARSPGSTRTPARRADRPRPHPLSTFPADCRGGRRVHDRVGAATIPRPVHTCVQTVRGRARRRVCGARRRPHGLRIPPDRAVRGHANRHRPSAHKPPLCRKMRWGDGAGGVRHSAW